MSSQRAEKVNELVKREMGQIFLREIEAPEGSLITITQVETTPDLLESKIWISVFPVKQANRVLKEINKRIGYLQGLLNRRLVIYPLPRIKFILDRTEDRVTLLEKIFNKIEE